MIERDIERIEEEYTEKSKREGDWKRDLEREGGLRKICRKEWEENKSR